MKRIHRFLEKWLGESLTWVIYGLCAAILFRVFILRQAFGTVFLDLVVMVGLIIVIVSAIIVLQRRAKKSHR